VTDPEGAAPPELSPRLAVAFLAALALVEHAADRDDGGGLTAPAWRAVRGVAAFRRFYVCPGGIWCRHSDLSGSVGLVRVHPRHRDFGGLPSAEPCPRKPYGEAEAGRRPGPDRDRWTAAENVVFEVLDELYKPSTGD